VRGARRRETNCELVYLDANQSRQQRTHTFPQDSFAQNPKNSGEREVLAALYALQELAERHLEGSRKSCQMAKSHLSRTPLEVGDVNLVNPRLLSEVDLPPTLLLAEVPDSFAKLDAHIIGHSSSIDLVEALYLVDALSR
jgi:hypothetical protein